MNTYNIHTKKWTQLHDNLISSDGGETWTNSKGEKYLLPITMETAEYASRIPQKSELINQTSMTADEDGNPYIATYYRKPDSQIPQYHVIYLRNKKWQDLSLDFRQTPFTLSGEGSNKSPTARPQIVFADNAPMLIFRDEERGSKVSVATCKDFPENQWQISDLTNYSVGDWEPTYDTELWREKKQLHLFVQKTEQKDGDGIAEMEAQPVSVLEIDMETIK